MGLCVRVVRGLAFAGLVLGGILVGAGVADRRVRRARPIAQTANSIVVEGNRRVEAETIRSYFKPGPGGRLGAAEIDEASRRFTRTGLFSGRPISARPAAGWSSPWSKTR